MSTVGQNWALAREWYSRGEAALALRALDGILAVAPWDGEARARAGDCLELLGQRPAAVAVWQAAAWHALKGGHPLAAIVQMRLLESAGQDVGDLLAALSTFYGAGSMFFGAGAARLSPAAATLPVAQLPSAPLTDGELHAMAQRAAQGLTGFDGYPEKLHPIPLLSRLLPPLLVLATKALLVRRLPGGYVVFEAGARGESCFLVASGGVHVLRPRQAEPVAELREGALFGEMALVQGGPRTATVKVPVSGDADLLEIQRSDLFAMAHVAPEVAVAVHAFARERVLQNVLRSSPLFQPFAAEQQRELLTRFVSRSAQPGDVLVAEGSPGEGLHLILSGSVRVASAAGGELARLGPGASFGEMALLGADSTTATVTATEPTELLFLNREYVARLIDAFPEILRHFARLAAERRTENEAKAFGDGGWDVALDDV